MKTTNKVFTEQIQLHIIECLSEDQTTVLAEQLENAVDGFNNWYGAYEQRRTPNKHKAFTEWLNGLPSELSVEFTHHGIYETLKAWFENVGETYKEMDSDKESDLYFHLVTREFAKLCKKNNVQF